MMVNSLCGWDRQINQLAQLYFCCEKCSGVMCAGTQKATYNGTGQPTNGETTSVYTLNFAGNCTAKSNYASKLPLTAQSA